MAHAVHLGAKTCADVDVLYVRMYSTIEARELYFSRACSLRMAVRHLHSSCTPLELEPRSRLGERLERCSFVVRFPVVHVFALPKIGYQAPGQNQSTTRQVVY
jgi:hypothetical protein